MNRRFWPPTTIQGAPPSTGLTSVPSRGRNAEPTGINRSPALAPTSSLPRYHERNDRLVSSCRWPLVMTYRCVTLLRSVHDTTDPSGWTRSEAWTSVPWGSDATTSAGAVLAAGGHYHHP